MVVASLLLWMNVHEAQSLMDGGGIFVTMYEPEAQSLTNGGGIIVTVNVCEAPVGT